MVDDLPLNKSILNKKSRGKHGFFGAVIIFAEVTWPLMARGHLTRFHWEFHS